MNQYPITTYPAMPHTDPQFGSVFNVCSIENALLFLLENVHWLFQIESDEKSDYFGPSQEVCPCLWILMILLSTCAYTAHTPNNNNHNQFLWNKACTFGNLWVSKIIWINREPLPSKKETKNLVGILKIKQFYNMLYSEQKKKKT